jgi:hypothetical protein
MCPLMSQLHWEVAALQAGQAGQSLAGCSRGMMLLQKMKRRKRYIPDNISSQHSLTKHLKNCNTAPSALVASATWWQCTMLLQWVVCGCGCACEHEWHEWGCMCSSL